LGVCDSSWLARFMGCLKTLIIACPGINRLGLWMYV
jgi:hypothetical protein